VARDGATPRPAPAGAGAYLLGFRRDAAGWGTGFPFDLPVVAAIEELSLDAPVTLPAGDNGTGSRRWSRR
jgi:hypothetical protein